MALESKPILPPQNQEASGLPRQAQLDRFKGAVERTEIWVFHGTGSIGAKAEQLFLKEEKIAAAGFVLNPREVLKTGWFDDFLNRNGILSESGKASPEALQGMVMSGTFSDEEMALLSSIAGRFKGTPLAVRSSAESDSRGTGIYKSHFCLNDGWEVSAEAELADAVKKVLASAYSKGAIAFRKGKGLTDGIAVMIEPVFGQNFSGNKLDGVRKDDGDYEMVQVPLSWFAPHMSGCGYTTLSSGGGYFMLVPGMPTAAVSNKGLQINTEEISDNSKTLFYFTLFGDCTYRKIGQGGGEVLFFKGYWEDGRGIEPLMPEFLHNIEPSLDLSSVDLRMLKTALEKLESLCGKPQYFEFAMRWIGEKEEYAILQIADAVPKLDFAVFPSDPKNVIAESTRVVGEGSATCEGVFVLPYDGCPQHSLSSYNEGHCGYLLIVDSTWFSKVRDNLSYSDFNNASAMIAFPGWDHNCEGMATMHFKGLFRETDKLFMEMPGALADLDWPFLEKLGIVGPPGLRLGPLSLRVEVIVSEKQKRGIAMLADD